MIYKEECRDLFSVSEEYYLAHCISADFGMGRGIVVEFNNRFDMKNKLISKYPNYLRKWQGSDPYDGDCILEGRVLNLVTKERYYMKPTYENIEKALLIMAILCTEKGIQKVAMPVIGCGLDKLDWGRVSEIIKDTFRNVDIEILVCKVA